MKHYAPNRCEPSSEVIMKMGIQWGGLGSGFGGVRVDVNVNEGLKLLCKFKKNGGRGSGQGGCERRIKVFVKMPKKKKKKRLGGGGGGGGVSGQM